MKIVPRKSFEHDTLGYFEKGVARDIDDLAAQSLLRMGHVVTEGEYQTKVVLQSPTSQKAPRSKRKA